MQQEEEEVQRRWRELPLNDVINELHGLIPLAGNAQQRRRWIIYKDILTRRMASLPFGEQLERLRMASVEPGNNAYYETSSFSTWKRTIQLRLEFFYKNRLLNDYLERNDVEALSRYNIPAILQDIQEWRAWRALHPEVRIREPSQAELERVTASLLMAQEAIRENQQQRQFAVAAGLHGRSSSILRRLDPLLVREIVQQHAYPKHEPWYVWF